MLLVRMLDANCCAEYLILNNKIEICVPWKGCETILWKNREKALLVLVIFKYKFWRKLRKTFLITNVKYFNIEKRG